MTGTDTQPELLFSYGTLQTERVQMATFGRRVVGTPDALHGFAVTNLVIDDAVVVALSGQTVHTMARYSGRDADVVTGVVLAITADELVHADQYEVAAVTRVRVQLRSGKRAWAYVDAQSTVGGRVNFMMNSGPSLPFDLRSGMAILGRTPSTLQALLHDLGPQWTDATEGPETWSPFVIVGHLLHGEQTDWIPRARLIRARWSSRRFTPFDRFAQLRASQGRTLADLLQVFAQARVASLATLTEWDLTDADLALEGEHPEFGLVTLRQLLATWVVHDLGHIAQIARVMAKQYRDAIGPWRAYLPIVDR